MVKRCILPLLSVLAILLTGLVPAAAAPTPAPSPVTSPVLPAERPYPAVLDAPIEYEGMTTCDPTPRPGALALRQLLLDTYGEAVIGISRACDQDTISEHKEGRAVDWMVNWKDPAERAQAQAFVDWVTAKGPDGAPAANARRLGIMYIGWGDEMWRAYDTGRGWTELKGCYSKQDSGSDTYCHRDHVHFSMTWDGAAGRTSYWDTTPIQDMPCPIVKTSGSARTLTAAAAFVPVKPARVFNSTTKGGGFGCYVQQRRWSGDDRSLSIQVAGKGGVPKTGVQAVAVRVTAYSSNAPGFLTASGSPGANGPQIVQLGMDGTSSATAIVPVSDTGRIWLATIAGHAQVAVDVLGYFARTPAAAATTKAGSWQPVVPKSVASVDLGPGASQTVKLDGAPAGVAGALLTLNTSGSAGGHIRVTPPGATTKADAVDVGSSPRSATVFAATSDGGITLANTSTASAKVTVMLSGWITKPTAGNARLAPAGTDLGTVKTGPGVVRVLSAKVPATARAAVVSVTTKGRKSAGGITVWGAGEQPAGRSVDVRAGRANSDLVIVPLSDDKSVRVAGDAKGGTASVRLVGVVR